MRGREVHLFHATGGLRDFQGYKDVGDLRTLGGSHAAVLYQGRLERRSEKFHRSRKYVVEHGMGGDRVAGVPD